MLSNRGSDPSKSRGNAKLIRIPSGCLNTIILKTRTKMRNAGTCEYMDDGFVLTCSPTTTRIPTKKGGREKLD